MTTPPEDESGAPSPTARPRGGPARRSAVRRSGARPRWWNEPRSAVLLVLGTVVIAGGARKLLQSLRARRAVLALEGPGVSPEQVAAAADHGRAGMMELFRLLGEGETEAVRDAAGHALSVLWRRDDLIPEEEQAAVRRGYQLRWHARRRYPRAMRTAVPIGVEFGVPFLRGGPGGVGPDNLEWSYRVTGARRASLEVFSPWAPGPGRAGFEVVPSDFDSDGPHRLVFQARARTRGLTDSWELDLPHVPFSFELDSRMEVASLLALPDEARAAAFARSVRLEPGGDGEEGEPGPAVFAPLNESLAVRGAPSLGVATPLPTDLAHAVSVEFEEVPGWYEAGSVLLAGQGGETPKGGPVVRTFPLGLIGPVPLDAMDRPGTRRMRARLTADPDRGWADPDVRSVWPGTIETGWVEVEVVRR